MTIPTNAFQTYSSQGGRESLADIIYNIDPFDQKHGESLLQFADSRYRYDAVVFGLLEEISVIIGTNRAKSLALQFPVIRWPWPRCLCKTPRWRSPN